MSDVKENVIESYTSKFRNKFRLYGNPDTFTAEEKPKMKPVEKRTAHPEPALIFIYNADSGLFNALTDMAHKTFSPGTYQCNLCALTYSTLGRRKSWKRFLETLERPFEFLHADELKRRYGISGVRLPAIYLKEREGLILFIDADSINACLKIEDLQRLIESRLEHTFR